MNSFSLRFLAAMAVAVAAFRLAHGQPPSRPDGIAELLARQDDRAEPWLSMSTDPAEIAAARAAAEAVAAQRYEDLLQSIGTGLSILDDEAEELIKSRRPDAVARLTRALGQDAVTDGSFAAALVLCRLREPVGRSYIARLLRDRTLEVFVRKRLLFAIHGGIFNMVYDDVDRKRYRDFLVADPEFVAAALAQLEDPDFRIAEEAVQCCGFLDVPGVTDRFRELLRRPSPPVRERILYWLSKGEITDELFDLALSAAKDKLEDAQDIFEAAAESKSEQIRSQAKTQLRALLANRPDLDTKNTDWIRLTMLSALSKAADRTDHDWLLKLAETECGRHALDPMTAYVRLFPDEGRRHLLQWLDDDKRRVTVVQAAAECLAATHDAEFVRAVAGNLDQVADSDLPEVLTALIKIGGEKTEPTIERVGNRLDPSYLAGLRQQFHPLQPSTYGEIAAQVREAGLLSAAEIDAALRQISTAYGRNSPGKKPAEAVKAPIDQVPGDLFSLLEAAHSTVEFDIEGESPPLRHDRLVRVFAGASRERFNPEAVLEIWDDKNPGAEEPYTLQFVVKTRLYRAELRELPSRYDITRVATMINAALADAGIDDRFIPLAADGTNARFVFADPKRLAPLAAEFGIRLSDEVAESLRQGKDFDERVRRALKMRPK